MRVLSNIDAVERNARGKPAAGVATTITVGADAGQFWVLTSVSFGYDRQAALAGELTVTFGGVVKLHLYVPIGAAVAGPYTHVFRKGLYTGAKNEEMVVTFSSPGEFSWAYGIVNITYK